MADITKINSMLTYLNAPENSSIGNIFFVGNDMSYRYDSGTGKLFDGSDIELTDADMVVNILDKAYTKLIEACRNKAEVDILNQFLISQNLEWCTK